MERTPVFVGCVTTLAGTALVAVPGRVGDTLGLEGQPRAIRAIGFSDLVSSPVLRGGRPRWPWMLARARRWTVAQAGYLHRVAPRSAAPAALEGGAAVLLGLTVVDGATALALRRATSRRRARDELAHAPGDVVARGADLVERAVLRVGEVPVDVALAGDDGQASPQPIVTTTSACSASSRVSRCGARRRGRCRARASTSTTSGCDAPSARPRCRPKRAVAAAGGALEQRRAHLRAPGVVPADEQRRGHGGLSAGLRARTIADAACVVHAVRRADLDVGQARRRPARRGTRPR